MGMFDFLKRSSDSEQLWKKTLIRDLVFLSAVDGEMDEGEVKIIFKIAVDELDLTPDQVRQLLENLAEVGNVYPQDIKTKQQYLIALCRLAYEDGVLHDNEVELMREVGRRMQLPDGFVDSYLEKIASLINSEVDEDDESINRIIITSPMQKSTDVHDEKGIENYVTRLSKLSAIDLCTELSNVLSAKHNLTSMPASIISFSETQAVVTDLVDKATLICFLVIGQKEILEYCNDDLRDFNRLVEDIDNRVASRDLTPATHGRELLNELASAINS
ncbi:hypothetical protein [Neptuniibacter sp.]|uniref:hypothetical protein n=1 Tax=Neptuniibacter sp. TaxID=1962643 RepID=UPI002610230C|nr:hypothetical protein [Neptuniibacter sp.]MCP4596147.1 TerB family tellurite resistance protein [Neptuniibacter sp.]